MIDHMEAREALTDAIAYARDTLPAPVREALAAANWSLQYGPGGADMSFGDAVRVLSAWADDIPDPTVWIAYDDADDDAEDDAGEYLAIADARDVVRAIVGPDLASYL